ncbi:MAG: hypothetical protein P1U62_09980 [Alteraurantiacibacter sp. bin_em_oilr2.035]|uniref:hypothetical protein n=1 Tax=Aurantiacibacter atlanticus TaxID=1648404 RepID=UPI000A568E01|nr:hypothetical protein [Aurantiacibacter atlanticus]MDF1835193.1 hypothetical protein [Alteraurantiacibacter sp. bin_em_oilr2.035]
MNALSPTVQILSPAESRPTEQFGTADIVGCTFARPWRRHDLFIGALKDLL